MAGRILSNMGNYSQKAQAPVVQTINSTFDWKIPIQWIRIRKTQNCLIHLIEVCPEDNAIHLLWVIYIYSYVVKVTY